MTLRLELPEEVVFSDGAKASTLDQLVAQIESGSDHIQELHEFLLNGHLELWLRRGGWAALGQWVRELQRCGGGQDPTDFARLLSTQIADRPRPNDRLRQPLVVRPSLTEEPTALPISSDGPEPPASIDDLLVRQRRSLHTFSLLEANRAAEEKAHARRIPEQEVVCRQVAANTRAEAENDIASRRKALEAQVSARHQARLEVVASVPREEDATKKRLDERHAITRSLIFKARESHESARRMLHAREIASPLDTSPSEKKPKPNGAERQSLEHWAGLASGGVGEIERALWGLDEWRQSQKSRQILRLIAASVVALVSIMLVVWFRSGMSPYDSVFERFKALLATTSLRGVVVCQGIIDTKTGACRSDISSTVSFVVDYQNAVPTKTKIRVQLSGSGGLAWSRANDRSLNDIANRINGRVSGSFDVPPGGYAALAFLDDAATPQASASIVVAALGRTITAAVELMDADRPRTYVPPKYPPLAAQARIQGVVRLKILVGTDGRVRDVQPVSGHPLLVPAAEEAVRQWVYKPTVLSGKPTEVERQVEVPFRLDAR